MLDGWTREIYLVCGGALTAYGSLLTTYTTTGHIELNTPRMIIVQGMPPGGRGYKWKDPIVKAVSFHIQLRQDSLRSGFTVFRSYTEWQLRMHVPVVVFAGRERQSATSIHTHVRLSL